MTNRNASKSHSLSSGAPCVKNAFKLIDLDAHPLKTFSHINSSFTGWSLAAERAVVVQAVILLCLQYHRTERLELRDLPRHKTLPCHIEFIRVSTLTAKNDLEFIRDKYFHDTSPEKLVVVVFLHHLPEEGEARHLDHLAHRQQHLWILMKWERSPLIGGQLHFVPWKLYGPSHFSLSCSKGPS